MRTALALLLCLASLPVQAQGWRGFVQDGITGTGTCPMNDAVTGNFACFMVECVPGRGLRYGIDIAGGDYGDAFTGGVQVDGRVLAGLPFARLPDSRWLVYRSPHDPALHGPLLAALQAGRRAQVDIDMGTARDIFGPISLAGSSRALAPVLAACRAALAAPPPATPRTDPARFLAFHGQETPEAEVEARAALAAVLAENDRMLAQLGAPRTQTLRAAIAAWPDGRRIMVAHIGHDTTAVYGMGASGSHIFTAQPGGGWVQHLGTTGLAVWMDTGAPGVQGWPDLWMQSDGPGMANPFALWRWNGTAYAHAGNAG
ncbi:MAG: hypothetical protein KF887_01540 [Paracoccaceae bacterium]|nr:MAG: hypothetical protein KF887_01540 [Paracoccaceae bacterium]